MFNGFLEIWAGFFYLCNKIFLLFAEKNRNQPGERKWRISAWAVYLVGLPAWVIIFIFGRNWIAAALEAGGAPAMLLGLILAIKGIEKGTIKWLDYIALFAVIVGIGYSLYDYRGLNTITQFLELSMVTGFLIGTYLLAKRKPAGYLFFMLMNGSNGTLMFLEHHPWLVVQQIISIGFVISAFIFAQQRKRKN